MSARIFLISLCIGLYHMYKLSLFNGGEFVDQFMEKYAM